MLVPVVTPTWQRRDILTGWCIPSVQAQSYPDAEHIVVSDGPDPELAAVMAAQYPDAGSPSCQSMIPVHGGATGPVCTASASRGAN